jgi:glycosyltransferase involved in cell wall biosynthesis
MNNPLVSIIVPCYNQAQYLGEALQSVLDQTYKNWECIIVNDGSPDNTEVIALDWLEKDSRFKYIYKENGGLSSARNAGITIAKGEFIQFLDSDDILESNKLQCQSKFFNTEIDVLISGYRYFEDSEGVSNLRILGRNNFIPESVINSDDKIDLKMLFDLKNPFVICAPLFRRNVFQIVGNFDEQLYSLEDWDFNLRCALHNMSFHHTGYQKDSKVLVRLHDCSLMRNEDKMVAAYKKFREKQYDNELYVSYFGYKNVKVNSSSKGSALRSFVKLFIPPIFLLIKRKIFSYKNV